jgi:predicted phosphohydrolase
MVTIAFTSDLHVDASPASAALVPHLVSAAEEAEPDVFLLAGDVGGGAIGLLGTLEAFGPLPVPKLFVPGNHDLWLEASGSLTRYKLDSATKYHSVLPALCEAAGWHYLPSEPFRFDGVGIAGAMGWYDYSLRNLTLDELIPREAYREGRFGRLVWNDARRIRWPKKPGQAGWRRRDACLGDEAILEGQVEGLEGHLRSLDKEGASSIVVATHFLPGPEPIQYTGEPKLDFVYGFAGSRRLGALLASRPSVKALICGHTHHPFQGTSMGLPLYKSPVGHLHRLHNRLYLSEKQESMPLASLAKERIGLLQVDGNTQSGSIPSGTSRPIR